MSEIPFVSFGNDELSQQPDIGEGDFVACPNCGEPHKVEVSTSDAGNCMTLEFYKCGEQLYLAGVDGKSVVDLLPRDKETAE